MSQRRAFGCILFAATAMVSGACRATSSRERATPEAPRLAKPSELTPAERQWGIGPRRGPDVTYQPDVVLLDGGPDAVVGQSPNGVEWIIDGDASHIQDVKPGKILFATSRVVGRVLHVRKQGDDVAVIMGPVELTEVVSHLKVQFHAPLDFSEALTYPAFPPGLSASGQYSARVEPPGAYGGDAHVVFLQAPGRAQNRAAPRQRVVPLVSLNGLGVRINVEGDGSHFDGDAMFTLATPELWVDIVIAPPTIRRAVLHLKGAAGLTFGFTASTDRGLAGNFEVVEPSLPTELSIPIFGPQVPMTVSLRQGFKVETGWGGKGSLTARADFTASGSYDLGYSDGKPVADGPTNFKWTVHPLASVGHVSPAHTGMVMAYQVKVIVGIGSQGFAAGPFVRMYMDCGISAESTLVTLRGCRNASIRVGVAAGFGYFLPQKLVEGINAILRALNLGAISSEGGKQTTSKWLVNSHTAVPPETCSVKGA